MMNQIALRQKKLLEDFFQAEEQRKQKEPEIQSRKAKAEKAAEDALNQAKASADSRRQRETEVLNQAKAEIDEALTVYQQVESNWSAFAWPHHQLSTGKKPERSRAILEEALKNFQLRTLEGNNSASACASKAKQLGNEILQEIKHYYQVESEASSAIQKMRSEWESLQSHQNVKYIRSELSSLQDQVNLAKRHFEEYQLLDYYQALTISSQVSSKISELIALANQRKSKRQKRSVGAIVGLVIGSIVGILGLMSSGAGGAIIGALVGFILFLIITIDWRT